MNIHDSQRQISDGENTNGNMSIGSGESYNMNNSASNSIDYNNSSSVSNNNHHDHRQSFDTNINNRAQDVNNSGNGNTPQYNQSPFPAMSYPTSQFDNTDNSSMNFNNTSQQQQLVQQRFGMGSIGDISQPPQPPLPNITYDSNNKMGNNQDSQPNNNNTNNNNNNNINGLNPMGSVGSPMLPDKYYNIGNAEIPAFIQPAKKRSISACDHCRKRKIRCGTLNVGLNKCNNCIKYRAECTFHYRDIILAKKKAANEEHPKKNEESSDESDKVDVTLSRNTNKPNEYADNDDDLYDDKNNETITKRKKGSGGIIKKYNKFSAAKIDRNESPDSKFEKLDKKVSMMIDTMARLEWMISDVIRKDKIEDKKTRSKSENSSHNDLFKTPLPKFKYYNTSILTTKKMQWVKDQTAPNMSDEDFIDPITKILNLSLKWYLVRNKNLIDFSSPSMIKTNVHIYPLPSKGQSKRLLENFHATLISSATGLISLEECYDLMERYFDEKRAPLTYPESLLLNVCLCAGANASEALLINEADFVRKDRYNPTRAELAVIENNLLLNCMYYYHKLSMLCSGITTVQALLLFTRYLADNLTTELADDVLTTAIKFAVDMRLGLRSYYCDISNTEYVLRRRLWWYCFCIDKKYSLILSRAPLLLESEMDLLTDDNYCRYIKEDVLTKLSDMTPEEINKIKDVKVALNAIVSYSEYIPYFMSYFTYHLVKIEAQIFETCFSSRMTVDHSFGYTLHQVVEIQAELDKWKNNLHECMKLDSYRQYLCILYTNSQSDNPVLEFEVACSRVINCHFRHLYMVIVLNLFALSFAYDNPDLAVNDDESLPSITKTCTENYTQACVEMLQVFLTTKYHPHRFNESMHHLFSGVFVLIFSLIKQMKTTLTPEIIKNVELLQTCHKHLLGENYEYLETKNIKWQVSVYFFTFLLKYTSLRVNEECDRSDNFDSRYYDNILQQILQKTGNQKDACIGEVYDNVKKCPGFDGVIKYNGLNGLGMVEPEMQEEINQMKVINREDISIFNDLTPQMLMLLDSDKAFNSKQIPQITKINYVSLFPKTTLADLGAVKNHDSGNPPEQDKQDDDVGIRRFLPFANMYFDREFFFMEIFKSYRSK